MHNPCTQEGIVLQKKLNATTVGRKSIIRIAVSQRREESVKKKLKSTKYSQLHMKSQHQK